MFLYSDVHLSPCAARRRETSAGTATVAGPSPEIVVQLCLDVPMARNSADTFRFPSDPAEDLTAALDQLLSEHHRTFRDGIPRVPWRVLEPEEPLSLVAGDVVAAALRESGWFESASVLTVEVVRRRIAVLGAHHPDTLLSRLGLALTALAEGELHIAAGELEAIGEDAAESLDATGPQDMVTVVAALALGHLAGCYQQLGYDVLARDLMADGVETLLVRASGHASGTVLLDEPDDVSEHAHDLLRASDALWRGPR